MSTLEVRLFGCLEITRKNLTISRFPTHKARGLFAYLAIHADRLHSRERLSGLFWPESSETAARKRLRTELWLTRRFLKAVETDECIVIAKNGSLGLNPATDIWIDRTEFEEKLSSDRGRSSLTPAHARLLEQAIKLYRGPLLDGSYEDWCLEERNYLEALRIAALEKLMMFHQGHQDWEKAIHYGTIALRQDPLAEHIHREVMRCHYRRHNRTAALRQFSRCVTVLAQELDVEPMPETVELCQKIRIGQDRI